MRRYAGGAARRGAEPPKMQCAVLERRRRRRAWRITDLASSGSAAPDTPSTTVSSPSSAPLTVRHRDVAGQGRRDRMRRPTARLGYAFRLYLLFATAAATAALHFAFAISRRSKRGTAVGSAQSAAVNNV